MILRRCRLWRTVGLFGALVAAPPLMRPPLIHLLLTHPPLTYPPRTRPILTPATTIPESDRPRYTVIVSPS